MNHWAFTPATTRNDAEAQVRQCLPTGRPDAYDFAAIVDEVFTYDAERQAFIDTTTSVDQFWEIAEKHAA